MLWSVKRFFLGVSCMLTATMISSCGQSEEQSAKDTQLEPPREEIVIWSYYETQEQQAGLTKLTQEFNKSQDQYEARWEYRGPSTEFTKQLSIGTAEDQLPDMVLIDNPDMRVYVELGIFEDITEYVEENFEPEEFYPEVISSVVYDGKYYGIPFCCNNVGLVYNKKMLEEANINPPQNWEEFYIAAKTLTSKEHYGFAMSAIMEEQSAFQVLPWILSTGETVESLGGDNTEKALTMLSDLVKEGYMSKGCINWSQVDVARNFIAGECAMMENGPWALPIVEKAGIDYGIVKLPIDEKSAVVAGGENLGIMKGKNVAGALAFVSYYYEEEVMIAANEQMYALPPIRTLAEKFQEKNPTFEVFVEQMESSVSRSSYEYWPKITRSLSKGLYGIITESETPKSAANIIKEGREN